jgi:hypothetical protein
MPRASPTRWLVVWCLNLNPTPSWCGPLEPSPLAFSWLMPSTTVALWAPSLALLLHRPLVVAVWVWQECWHPLVPGACRDGHRDHRMSCCLRPCVSGGGCSVCCTRVVTKLPITRTCLQMCLGGYVSLASHADTLSVGCVRNGTAAPGPISPGETPFPPG